MNKGEFINMVAECMGDSKAAAGRWVDCVLDCLTKGVKANGRVALSGFGVFQVRQRAARKGVNPKTGESIEIQATRTVAFRAARTLKDAV